MNNYDSLDRGGRMVVEPFNSEAFTGIFASFGILWLAIVVFGIVVIWKIFVKAGKPGWACLIPIYNVLVFLQIVNRPWWWIFLFFIPIVNIVMLVIVYHDLAKSFGKDAGFTVGLVFVNIVFMAILAFDSSVYTRLHRETTSTPVVPPQA